MDLNEIRIFTKVVEEKSFTSAAKVLGLPKSHVSRKISQLESRLGILLLQRTTRNLTLTESGVSYYESCAKAIHEVEIAENTINRMQATPRGLLRITTPPDLGSSFLGAFAAEFLQKHQDVQIEIYSTNRTVNLIEEGFDIAFRAGKLQDSSLIARKLGSTKFVTCATPQYLKNRGTPKKPGDLKNHDCMLLKTDQGVRSWPMKGLKGKLNGRLYSSSFVVLKEAVLADLGLGFFPSNYVCEEIRKGELAVLLEKFNTLESTLSAVYPASRHLTPKVRLFLDFIYERLTPFPWEIEPSKTTRKRK